jgi:hypothetical protein
MNPSAFVGIFRLVELNIMENDLIQAYDRRMRRFNLAVIASALVSLAILFSFLPYLQ